MLRRPLGWRRGAHRLRMGSGASLALDAVQEIVLAAYSQRRQMFSNFTDSPYSYRRFSDSAVQAAVFVDGEVDFDAVTTFTGPTGTAYIDGDWKDQSGNGRHATVTGTPRLKHSSTGIDFGFYCDGSSYFQPPSNTFSGCTSGAVFALVKAANQTIFRLTADGSTPFQPFGDGNCYSSFLSTSRPNLGAYGVRTATDPRLHVEVQTGTHLKAYDGTTQKGSTTAATFSTTLTQRQFGDGINTVEFILLSRAPTTDELALIVGDMMTGNGL